MPLKPNNMKTKISYLPEEFNFIFKPQQKLLCCEKGHSIDDLNVVFLYLSYRSTITHRYKY